MRFRFCGDLDCPDWLLQEVATLSKISSVRIKVMVKQVIGHLLSGEIDCDKVVKITKETLPDASDIKGAIAGLNFILSNAAKYDVDEQTLLQEIQQLGMPKENSEALVRPFRESKDELRRRFVQTTYHLPKLTSMDWRVDHLIASNKEVDLNEPCVQLKLQVDHHPHHHPHPLSTTYGIRVSKEKFLVLHRELEEASKRLEEEEDEDAATGGGQGR